MRSTSVLGIAGVLFVVGCHGGAKPVDSTSLFRALEAKAAVIPKSQQTYDLRTSDGLSALTAALKPYDGVLDEAHQALEIRSLPEPFLPAADFTASKVVPGSKHDLDLKNAVFIKRLVKDLVARGRLEYVDGQSAKGLTDLKTAAQITRLYGSREGSVLAALIDDACAQVILTGIRRLSIEANPGKDEFAGLAAVADSLGSPLPYLPLIKAAHASEKGDGETTPAQLAEAKKTYTQIEKALTTETTDPAAALAKILKLAGGMPSITVADPKPKLAPLLMEAFAMRLRMTAMARMTAGYCRALAEKDKTGHLPATLPASGLAATDPFGSGSLGYRRTADGFVITAPASHGYISGPVDGDPLQVAYPTTKDYPVNL